LRHEHEPYDECRLAPGIRQSTGAYSLTTIAQDRINELDLVAVLVVL
jgi:hypothetical protein